MQLQQFRWVHHTASAVLLAATSGFSMAVIATEPTPFDPTQVVLPADSQYDWLQLTSLELLKGEIKNLYDDKLEFESDNLDTLYIDWEDVKLLQSQGLVSIGFTDLSTQTGKLLVKDGKSYLDGVEFDRNDIMTIIAGAQQESNYWSSKISLGANFRSGNTEQVDYSAIANAKRRTTESRYLIDYLGNYSNVDDNNTIDNHRINTNFDWYISKQFYLRPVFAEIYLDKFKNIDYKATLGFGLGYDIIDTSKVTWSVSGGPAYTYTKYDKVSDGAVESEGSAAVVIESVYEWEITDDIDFDALYRVNYGSEDSGGYSHHAVAAFAIELTDMFDLDLSFVWDRISNPQDDAEGITPEKDDFQFIVGFGIDL
ncbi:DUF481 domain-containing protein [Shewanella sp. Scap07]|uniref:DUF481 domain-containing protein n=1 Tax=Shewanella sp. Scap07 TaxID=2589987 RepID=UPI0015BECB50|nr:DUF481 domain-containing protein [Shewanella sp. Scap07]QLE85078.1 DUF481 domain-containing protein [Shewanella sp. Scap07]